MALYRRGKIWWYSFEFEGRRIQESTGFRNKKRAKDAESTRRTELLERRAGITRRDLPPRFEEYVSEFLAWSKKVHRPKTYSLHKLNCETLKDHFKKTWLDEITTAKVEGFRNTRIAERRRNGTKEQREKGTAPAVSPATVNRALSTLRLLLNRARKRFAVPDPFDGFKFLRESPGKMRVVSFEEEVAYLAAASQPLHDVARVILDTGMRPEEAFRIEVANVDLERKTIFNPFGKTRAARRTLTMTDEVFRILKARVADAEGRYVFPSPENPERPIGSVRKAHDAAVRRAKIAENFRLYDLRHTFASRAAMAGVPLPTLGAILGHTTIQMTTRYVHPDEEHKREAVKKLEDWSAAEAVKAAQRSQSVTTNSTTLAAVN